MAESISMALDQTTLANAFAAMVLKELDEGQREHIITQAITYIIEPRDQGYGRRGNSILQDAFNQAIATLTHKIAASIVEDDQNFVSAITAEVHAAMAKILEERGELRTKVATALAEVVW